MSVAVVRYRNKPDRADDLSFVPVAAIETDDGTNPLTGTPAFVEFVREIADRCAEGPVASGATIVGSYQFFPAY